MTAETRSLHRKLAEVMAEAERVPKRGKAPAAMGGFEFVQVGDAADFIRKALGDRKITMLPTGVEIVGQSEHATKSGGTMTTVELRTTWTLTDGESGESIAIQSYGAGADGGDKYSGKAQTNAMKYALLMGFLLSTGDDPELSNSEDRRAKGSEPLPDPMRDGLIGTAEIGKGSADFELRQGKEGPFLQFKLKNGHSFRVDVDGGLAEALQPFKAEVIDHRVTVWGRIIQETFTPKGTTRQITYNVIKAVRIATADWTLPAPDTTTNMATGHEHVDEEMIAADALAIDAELATLPW